MDTTNSVEGLVIKGEGDLHLMWTREYGYVRFRSNWDKFQPKSGDWVQAQCGKDSIHTLYDRTSYNVKDIDVLEWKLLKQPCPIFLHFQSGYPCLNVIAERYRNTNDHIHIKMLNVLLDVPSALQHILLESNDHEFVATLHFCHFDEALPNVLAISSVLERRGIVTAVQLHGSQACELSVGVGTFVVEPQVVKYAESVYRTCLKRGQRIKAVFRKFDDNDKAFIFFLHILKNNGSELVYPASDLGVKMEFEISPIDDRRYDDRGDYFYISDDDIPVYPACDLPNNNSLILVSANRVSDSNGCLIWRITEYYPSACEPTSSTHTSLRENRSISRTNVEPFERSSYRTRATCLSTGPSLVPYKLLNCPPSLVQRKPTTITSDSPGVCIKPIASTHVVASVKKRTSFDVNDRIHTFVDKDVQPAFSMRRFIAEEELLAKPLMNLSKQPTRSILRSSIANDDQKRDELPNECTFDEESSAFSHSSVVDSTVIDGLYLSSYLTDGDCGCSEKWLNYIKDKPRPEDIHSETISKEAVLFISCHKHNVGTVNEFEVWRGYTCNSFSGVIELIPSTYYVPIKVNLGTWVAVSILKIITKQRPQQRGYMIKHSTIWNYHTDHEPPKYEVKEQGNHRWIQVHADLSRLADSRNLFIASYFGNVFVSSKLLEPFPAEDYRQLFKSWIEPLARPIKQNNEWIFWKAVNLKLYKVTSCHEHNIEVQKSSSMATVEWGPDSTKVFSWRDGCKLRKAPRDYQKRKQEALKHTQILVPKSERVQDIVNYISLLCQHSSKMPDFVAEEVVLPSTILLESSEKKGHKVRQVIKILVDTFILTEGGRSFMENVHFTDPLKKQLVYLLKVNLSFLKFDQLGHAFESAYRHFVSYNDVSTSDSEADSSL